MIWSRSWFNNPIIRKTNTLLVNECRRLIPRISTLTDIPFTPIPAYGVTHTLDDAANEHAEEIIKKNHKSLMCLFSGGVDSTIATTALVNTGVNPIIGITPSTLKYTDPKYLKWLGDNGCSFQVATTHHLRKYVESGGHFITGTHGDNLVLGDSVYFYNAIEDVWGMTPNDLIQRITGRTGNMWEYYKDLFDEMPDEIERTAPNLLWWVAFCFYWHRDSIYLSAQSNLGMPGMTHTHFFSTQPFQKLMMQDAGIKAGKLINNHKQMLIDAAHRLSGFKFDIKQKTDGTFDIIDCGVGQLESVLSITDNWIFERVQDGYHLQNC